MAAAGPGRPGARAAPPLHARHAGRVVGRAAGGDSPLASPRADCSGLRGAAAALLRFPGGGHRPAAGPTAGGRGLAAGDREETGRPGPLAARHRPAAGPVVGHRPGQRHPACGRATGWSSRADSFASTSRPPERRPAAAGGDLPAGGESVPALPVLPMRPPASAEQMCRLAAELGRGGPIGRRRGNVSGGPGRRRPQPGSLLPIGRAALSAGRPAGRPGTLLHGHRIGRGLRRGPGEPGLRAGRDGPAGVGRGRLRGRPALSRRLCRRPLSSGPHAGRHGPPRGSRGSTGGCSEPWPRTVLGPPKPAPAWGSSRAVRWWQRRAGRRRRARARRRGWRQQPRRPTIRQQCHGLPRQPAQPDPRQQLLERALVAAGAAGADRCPQQPPPRRTRCRWNHPTRPPTQPRRLCRWSGCPRGARMREWRNRACRT